MDLIDLIFWTVGKFVCKVFDAFGVKSNGMSDSGVTVVGLLFVLVIGFFLLIIFGA
jgi:hypothetical protein